MLTGCGLHLDGIVTVIDAETTRIRSNDRYVGDTVRRQIVTADLLILNKIDLITPTELASLRTWLTSLGDQAKTMINAVPGQVALDVLLGSGDFASSRAEVLDDTDPRLD
jgi:G3E family GTPase